MHFLEICKKLWAISSNASLLNMNLFKNAVCLFQGRGDWVRHIAIMSKRRLKEKLSAWGSLLTCLCTEKLNISFSFLGNLTWETCCPFQRVFTCRRLHGDSPRWAERVTGLVGDDTLAFYPRLQTVSRGPTASLPKTQRLWLHYTCRKPCRPQSRDPVQVALWGPTQFLSIWFSLLTLLEGIVPSLTNHKIFTIQHSNKEISGCGLSSGFFAFIKGTGNLLRRNTSFLPPRPSVPFEMPLGSC